MLPRRTIELILHDCMIKYTRENDGAEGWSKADIQEAVRAHGGGMEDVFAVLKLGLMICTGEEEMPGYVLN